MLRTFSLGLRWSRPSTLAAASGMRVEVCPPSLRCQPATAWRRCLFWLLAPAPHCAALPPDRLPGVRLDFMATMADLGDAEADVLRQRIDDARSMRDLWHLRSAIYRVVGIAHSQSQAELRLALLNRHFPTRSPRSQFAVL